MQHDEFLKTLSERTGLERDDADRAAVAVLTTLGERITQEEAEDLAAQLPSGLESVLQGSGRAERFDLDEFLRRVAEREGADTEEAREHARAVFEVLREAVTKEELSDVLSQLPREFEPLFA